MGSEKKTTDIKADAETAAAQVKRDAGAAAGRVQQDAGQAADRVQQDAGQAAGQVQHDAGAATEQVKKDVSEAVDQVGKDAAAAAETAKQGVNELGKEARRQVDAVAKDAKAGFDEVAHSVSGMANDQKNLLAGQIGGVADALDKVAGELDSNNGPVAGYVHAAADRARDMTQVVRDSSIEEIVAKAEDFGRRQPLLFVSGAALAGFAASRFLRASAHHSRQPR